MIFPNKTLASHSGGKESLKQHIKESSSLERVTGPHKSELFPPWLPRGETEEKKTKENIESDIKPSKSSGTSLYK